MSDVRELSVDELSSSTEETSKSLEISISKITTTIKLAMGIVTIGDIFPNLLGTIKLVCHSCDNQNSFSKLKLTNDKKTLVGVMFIGKSQVLENDCFFVKSRLYKSVLKYKIFSIQIENESHRELITGEFNKWFKQFTSTINIEFKLFNKERNQQQQLSCCFPNKKKMVYLADSPPIPNALELSKMSRSESQRKFQRVPPCDYEKAAAACALSVSYEPEPNYYLPSAPSDLCEAGSDKTSERVMVKSMEEEICYRDMCGPPQAGESWSYVQSPMPIDDTESHLVENRLNTLNKFDMYKNLVKVKGKKNKQEKKQMDKLINDLSSDLVDCKSYRLKLPKPILAIKAPKTPSPPLSPSSPIYKNSIIGKVSEV